MPGRWATGPRCARLCGEAGTSHRLTCARRAGAARSGKRMGVGRLGGLRAREALWPGREVRRPPVQVDWLREEGRRRRAGTRMRIPRRVESTSAQGRAGSWPESSRRKGRRGARAGWAAGPRRAGRCGAGKSDGLTSRAGRIRVREEGCRRRAGEGCWGGWTTEPGRGRLCGRGGRSDGANSPGGGLRGASRRRKDQGVVGRRIAGLGHAGVCGRGAMSDGPVSCAGVGRCAGGGCVWGVDVSGWAGRFVACELMLRGTVGMAVGASSGAGGELAGRGGQGVVTA